MYFIFYFLWKEKNLRFYLKSINEVFKKKNRRQNLPMSSFYWWRNKNTEQYTAFENKWHNYRKNLNDKKQSHISSLTHPNHKHQAQIWSAITLELEAGQNTDIGPYRIIDSATVLIKQIVVSLPSHLPFDSS